MDIYEFYSSGKDYSIAEITADEELTTDIQKILIWLKLLDPPIDGKFGPITTNAFQEFQQYMNCPQIGVLDNQTAKQLIETEPAELFEVLELRLKPGQDLAGRIIKYMMVKNYHISIRADECNIVYVEGMNGDGTINTDAPNKFNDRRLIIQIVDGIPKIAGNWQATTEPGNFYTINPMNPKGAARIKFEQYKAWRVGTHATASVSQYPALVQATSVTVHRDFDRNGIRTGDKLDTGSDFGINQHHANSVSRDDIGMWSAGCLVGRFKNEHDTFMQTIMQDRRYKLNPNYLFETTIIPGDDLLKQFPII